MAVINLKTHFHKTVSSLWCNLGNEQRALTGLWPIPAFTLALEKGYKVAKITEVWHFNKDCPNSKAPPNAQIWRMAHVYPLWPTPSQHSFWVIFIFLVHHSFPKYFTQEMNWKMGLMKSDEATFAIFGSNLHWRYSKAA